MTEAGPRQGRRSLLWVLHRRRQAAPGGAAENPAPPPALLGAEENLDDAAAEGAVGVVVPLLKKLNGGDMLAQEQPSIRWDGRMALSGRSARGQLRCDSLQGAPCCVHEPLCSASAAMLHKMRLLRCPPATSSGCWQGCWQRN